MGGLMFHCMQGCKYGHHWLRGARMGVLFGLQA